MQAAMRDRAGGEPVKTGHFDWCVISSENRFPLFGITH
jgi:hypothetical protein